MRKFFIGGLLTATTLLLAATFFQRHALACELLPVLNYQKVKGGIFVGSGTSEEQADTFKGLVNSAAGRIGNIYGIPTSTPRLLITSNSEMAAEWSANETASMHRMPWRSCIVIGPKGQNVDVIAHEWMHAEIQHRVGFLRFFKEVPVWFDEGAALTLDYREPFMPENISLSDVDILAVQSLRSGRTFFSGNIRENYQAARMAVEPLILNERFYNDLERISSGESFENVFLKASKSMQPTADASVE